MISYEFGSFRMDIAERRLWRGEELISLPPKAFDTLAALVRKSGQLVTKDELFRDVWQDAFVEESNLSNNVYTLRKVLGHDANGRGYIETVPRHGYRFTADVVESSGGAEALLLHRRTRARVLFEAEESDGEVGTSLHVRAVTGAMLPVAPRNGQRFPLEARWLIVLAAVAAVAAIFYAWQSPKATPGRRVARSIAVLPFKPIGVEGRDEHLGLGMTDATITKLSGLPHFTVRPTSAVFKYTDQNYDGPAAGRELGVDAVLEGTTQRVGDRVRCTVQLTDVADGEPVWAASFDESFTDIFAIQDAISAQVAQALSLKLSGAEEGRLAKRHTHDVEAYQSFVKGIYFWNQRTEDGIRRSIEHFKRAVAHDASYALAYAGLADAYGMAGYYAYESVGKREDVYKEAAALAARALQLDDGVAEAHLVLALVKTELDNDPAGAEREYRRTLELNPDSALARHRYSVFLLRRGRVDEAVVESKKASDLDPVSMVVGTSHCSALYFKRDYGEAATCSRRALEIHPDGSQALLLLGLSLAQQGRYDESIPPLKKVRELSDADADVEALRSLGHVYALSGRKQEARKILSRLDGLPGKHDEASVSKALIHSALGEMDQVFAVLEERAPQWCEEPVGLRIDPRYDPIKVDPRYAELLKRRFG